MKIKNQGKELLEIENNKSSKADSIIIGILTFLICVMIILIGYRYSFITVEVSGSSMEQTISDGDIYVANRFALPNRGDIAIIDKGNDFWLIKRIIAVGGDTIKIEGEDVYLKKTGESDFSKLDEPYAYYDDSKSPENYNIEITLNDGEYFFLGDNRRNSSDSRLNGVRTKYDIVGVITEWSLNRSGFWYSFDKIANAPSRWISSLTKQTEDENDSV